MSTLGIIGSLKATIENVGVRAIKLSHKDLQNMRFDEIPDLRAMMFLICIYTYQYMGCRAMFLAQHKIRT